MQSPGRHIGSVGLESAACGDESGPELVEVTVAEHSTVRTSRFKHRPAKADYIVDARHVGLTDRKGIAMRELAYLAMESYVERLCEAGVCWIGCAAARCDWHKQTNREAIQKSIELSEIILGSGDAAGTAQRAWQFVGGADQEQQVAFLHPPPVEEAAFLRQRQQSVEDTR